MSATFHEQTLPNGLRIVCEVLPGVQSAAAAFFVRTGSRHEAVAEHGVSHFLEHMCFKGTSRRTWADINIRFDELGSIYNAYTSKEHTTYFGWLPAARLEPQIELLADMMRPSLPAEEFATERQVILEEIAMSADNFDRHVWNFLHEVVFGTHPLGHEILGEKETIEHLAHETLVEYHRRRYAPERINLVAAGALDPQAVFAAAERYCGAWQPAGDGEVAAPTVAPLPAGTRHLPLERFKQQSVLLVYPAVPQGHPDEEVIEAFTSLFGGSNSRCYWNIVQKGIATGAGATWIAYQDCGYLVLYADGEPERTPEMLAALRVEAQRVMQAGVEEDEVERVKNKRRTHLSLEAESPRTRMMQLIDELETHGHPRSASERLAEVERIRARDVQAFLERYPINGDGLVLTCGPHA